MSQIDQVTINNLTEFTAEVEKSLGLMASSSLWYRGCRSSSYELLPSLYRQKAKTLPQILSTEKKIVDLFKQRSGPFMNRVFADEANWEWLFYMQHFRVPTRLLDWTENPFVALYFSLGTETDYSSEDAAVWILNPEKWNKTILKGTDFSGDILTVNDEYVRGYAPQNKINMLSASPLAMYGIYNNHRIVSQRGVFTVFGKNRSAMEEIATAARSKGLLRKLLIPKTRRKDMFASLISIGYTDGVIFPDLEGLVIELKRKFNFLGD